MKIIIKRSFERTRQIADFVPIKVACEVSAEIEYKNDGEILDWSNKLDDIVQSEVEKSLIGYRPACIGCGGKQIVGGTGLNKEGMCQTCADKLRFEAADFRKENLKKLK